MSQIKISKNVINWELVAVNPNSKNWDWKDLFCFWSVNVQSIIGFSLIASLYTLYNLNFFVVFFGTILGSILVYFFSTLIGKPSQKYGLPFATLLTEFLLGLEMNKYLILAMIMVMIFLLGWPLEWVPIVMIIIPIILPLVEALGFNLTWFAILVAVNLQTAWLSPPVALSAYFLKGVVPEWDLKDIYYGMMQFMVLQVIGLILIIVFPQIALWLPTLLYGQ